MSLYSKRLPKKGTLSDVVSQLSNRFRGSGNDFVSTESIDLVTQFDSLTDGQSVEFEHSFNEVSTSLESLWGDVLGDNLEGGHLTNAQKAAGAIIAMTHGAPQRYAEQQVSNLNVVSSEAGITVIEPEFSGIAGELDYRSNASMEAFDEQELRNHLPFSIAFNVQAARQDEFSEAFYKTIVITPDQPGLDIVIRRTLVFNEIRHSLAAKPTDFDKRNLVEAQIDHRILASESVRAIPVADTDNPATPASNANIFAAGITPTSYTVDTHDFYTAPLRTGVEINLIGASSHPGLLQTGMLTNEDSLDARLHLETLYMRIVDDGPPVADEFVALSVDRLPLTQFYKSVEGHGRKMLLSFTSDMLTLSKDTKGIDGAQPAQLAAFFDGAYEDTVVRFKISVTGEANVEFGNVEVHVNRFEIDSFWDKASDGTLTLVADQGAATTAFNNAVDNGGIIGYDIHATRSNQQRRVRGLLIDTNETVERHTVMMGSPITVLSPVNSSRDASDLTAAVAAARTRNSNQAVTTLLNRAASLEALEISRDRMSAPPQIEGAGRWMVRPFFESISMDMLDHINSLKSHERAADVSAALINAIREVTYRMYRDTGYQPALDSLTGGTGEKPTVLIGTDPVTAKHLNITGDTRITGHALDFLLVTSVDQRVYDKIFVTFIREGSDGPDPLTFGNHVWIPELASTVQVSRAGATVKEAQVQPRNRHINNLPILAVFDISNLKEAVAETIPHPAP